MSFRWSLTNVIKKYGSTHAFYVEIGILRARLDNEGEQGQVVIESKDGSDGRQGCQQQRARTTKRELN